YLIREPTSSRAVCVGRCRKLAHRPFRPCICPLLPPEAAGFAFFGLDEHARNRLSIRMTDKPVTTYVVSVFEKPHWRTVLTTKDKAKALAMAKEIGDKVRVEEITPKMKRR
ncbi:hypothetical protein, partial [Mesorhizobium kowhaii]|uniref:hypothetical protein n=2 Tax=Mesorhizobium kowhaii TaxID=1300272 RepID=UPI001ABFB49A